MRPQYKSAGHGRRLFIVYSRSSQRVSVLGNMLRSTNRAIRNPRDIQVTSQNACLVEVTSREAPTILKQIRTGRIGVIEILTQKPLRLDRHFRLELVPHKHMTGDQFAKSFNLDVKVAKKRPAPRASKPKQHPSPPSASSSEPDITVSKEEKKKVVVLSDQVALDDTLGARETSEDTISIDESSHSEEVEDADDPSESTEEDSDGTLPWDVADRAAAETIPYESLKDPSQFKMTELRTFGEAFEPAINGISKASVAEELRKAGSALGLSDE